MTAVTRMMQIMFIVYTVNCDHIIWMILNNKNKRNKMSELERKT